MPDAFNCGTGVPPLRPPMRHDRPRCRNRAHLSFGSRMGRGSIQVNARIGGCPDPGSEKRHSIAYVRPQANLPSLAFAGLASDLPGPKTRAAIWSTAAWQSRRRSTPKVFADLTRDHVLSTVSPAQQGRALGYSSEITVAWATGTLRHPWRSFFFKNPSFDCIVA